MSIPPPSAVARGSDDASARRPRRFDLTFRRCTTAQDRLAVFTLRQEVWKERSGYLLGNRQGRHPAEDPHDDVGFLFACFDGATAVAACRFAPPGPRGFEAEEACAMPADALADRATLLQVSRVVVHDAWRARAASATLLLEACRSLLATTPYRHWFALCVPRLADHYTRFGAARIGGFEVTLAARGGNTYHAVRGTIPGSIAAIEASLDEEGARSTATVATGAAAALERVS